MTNEELYTTFQNINLSNDNIFDKYVALNNQDKMYKTTDFYKATKKSIYEAYDIYMQQEGKLINIIDVLTDPEKIDLLLNHVMSIFDVEKYMDQLSPENKQLLGEMFKNIQ